MKKQKLILGVLLSVFLLYNVCDFIIYRQNYEAYATQNTNITVMTDSNKSEPIELEKIKDNTEYDNEEDRLAFSTKTIVKHKQDIAKSKAEKEGKPTRGFFSTVKDWLASKGVKDEDDGVFRVLWIE